MGVAIGVAGGMAIRVAGKIGRVASSGARDTYIASKGLWKGVDTNRAVANLSKVKLSWSYRAIVIIGLILIRARLISLSVYL